MKEEASPREAAHLRREVVGRKKCSTFILNHSWNKTSPDLATFLLPTSPSVSGSRTALAPLTCICSCQICWLFRLTKYRKNLHLPRHITRRYMVPYRVSEKELFLFSIHASHGKPLLVATYTHTYTHVWNVNILLSVVRSLLPS